MVAKPKYKKTIDGYKIMVGKVSISINESGFIFVVGAISTIPENKMQCSASLQVAENWTVQVGSKQLD